MIMIAPPMATCQQQPALSYQSSFRVLLGWLSNGTMITNYMHHAQTNNRPINPTPHTCTVMKLKLHIVCISRLNLAWLCIILDQWSVIKGFCLFGTKFLCSVPFLCGILQVKAKKLVGFSMTYPLDTMATMLLSRLLMVIYLAWVTLACITVCSLLGITLH